MFIGVHSVALPSVLQVVCLRLSFHSLPRSCSPSLSLLPSFSRSVTFLSSFSLRSFLASEACKRCFVPRRTSTRFRLYSRKETMAPKRRPGRRERRAITVAFQASTQPADTMAPKRMTRPGRWERTARREPDTMTKKRKAVQGSGKDNLSN